MVQVYWALENVAVPGEYLGGTANYQRDYS